jgi:hypothetical protein
MFNESQLLQAVEDLAQDRISIGDFECWFRLQSRDVHKWGNVRINELVDAAESVFSEYYFEDLDDAGFRRAMANAIRPFEEKAAVQYECAFSSNNNAPTGWFQAPSANSSYDFTRSPVLA